MSELDTFVSAVSDGKETIEMRGLEPETVLYDTKCAWFSEDPVRLSEVMTDGVLADVFGIDTDIGAKIVVTGRSGDDVDAVTVSLE